MRLCEPSRRAEPNDAVVRGRRAAASKGGLGHPIGGHPDLAIGLMEGSSPPLGKGTVVPSVVSTIRLSSATLRQHVSWPDLQYASTHFRGSLRKEALLGSLKSSLELCDGKYDVSPWRNPRL
jgi:hypothetical protein